MCDLWLTGDKMFAELSTPTVPTNACETASGRYVDVVTPDPKTIVISDIAWALARQARFGGHTLSENVWSVAQHSIFVTELLQKAISGKYPQLEESLCRYMNEKGFDIEVDDSGKLDGFNHERLIMGALLHDASETYLIDLPSPVKRHEAVREPYKALERGINTAIYLALGLEELTPKEHMTVTWADMLALHIEAANLMPSRARGWNAEFPPMSMLEMHLMPAVKPWREVYEDFLAWYEDTRYNLM
jgi:hypothetical protein